MGNNRQLCADGHRLQACPKCIALIESEARDKEALKWARHFAAMAPGVNYYAHEIASEMRVTVRERRRKRRG